jgi:hypothetical protein
MSWMKQHHWNEKIVMAYLEDAAAIHRRLPEVKVAGYFSLWPDTMKDDWTRLYDAVNGKNRIGPPNAREVTYHEEIMQWLRWLERPQQQIVWMRANRIPWKVLVDQFGISRVTLWHDMNSGLLRIASILSEKGRSQ